MPKITVNRRPCTRRDFRLVYDAEKALQHKQEIDKAISDFEAWEKKQDRIRLILGLLLAGGFVAACSICAIRGDQDAAWVVFVIALAACIPIAIVATCWDHNIDAARPSEKYTPDIEYYLATEGKRILNIRVRTDLEYLPSVIVITENPDHSTSETEFHFKVIHKTNLSQTILNVNDGVIYTPYTDN